MPDLKLSLKDPAGLVLDVCAGLTAEGSPYVEVKLQPFEGLWLQVSEGHVVQIGWRTELAAEIHWSSVAAATLADRVAFIWQGSDRGRVIWLPESRLALKEEGCCVRI